MGKFMDMLRKADAALELGLDFNKIFGEDEVTEENKIDSENIMPKSSDAPAAEETAAARENAAAIAGYRDAFHSFILDNEEIPGELTEELAD